MWMGNWGSFDEEILGFKYSSGDRVCTKIPECLWGRSVWRWMDYVVEVCKDSSSCNGCNSRRLKYDRWAGCRTDQQK